MTDATWKPVEIFPSDPDFEFDLDFLFDSVPDDLALDFILPESTSILQKGIPLTRDNKEEYLEMEAPTESPLSWANELEQFLLVEEEEVDAGEKEVVLEEFLSDVIAEENKSIEETESEEEKREKEERRKRASSAEGENGVSEAKSGEEGMEVEEEISKKRIRQLRNRDSAMKSRERRKIYVQNLEVKSKFLESECKRLEHLLQCCTAENIALKHCLQKNRASGVSQARQESAVLFTESLLLGSLFWLVSIVFLFLAPNLLAWRPPVEALEKARDLGPSQNQETVVVKRSGSEMLTFGLASHFFFMRRRFKALKPKLKISLTFPCLMFDSSSLILIAWF